METPFSVDYAPNEYDVYLESFDHNQTPGNYQAWCKGGNITTENIRDRELKFTCTSALYPVYRNYKFNGHINHPILFEVPAEKDFSGGDVLIQIIDPYADPLIDDTEEPIEEDSINDVANVRDILTINFTPEKTGEYILRLYARNASGNVYFETKYVEQRSL
jgi:hypothetical protein